MLTVIGVLVIAAIIMTLWHAGSPGKPPLWVPLLLICLVELLRILPLGR